MYDITIEGEKQTIKIKKTSPINPNKKEVDTTKLYHRIVGIVLGLWGLFCAIVPIISLLLPDDESEPTGLISAFLMGTASLIGAYYILKRTSSK
ncbi:MAG: hypothetical protein IJ745_07005 [Bacteroidales bacterium]|nr:hypothetical protein [Bacteroidales bacterium]